MEPLPPHPKSPLPLVGRAQGARGSVTLSALHPGRRLIPSSLSPAPRSGAALPAPGGLLLSDGSRSVSMYLLNLSRPHSRTCAPQASPQKAALSGSPTSGGFAPRWRHREPLNKAPASHSFPPEQSRSRSDSCPSAAELKQITALRWTGPALPRCSSLAGWITASFYHGPSLSHKHVAERCSGGRGALWRDTSL